MTRGAALLEALLVTLATPATWPLALGAFLLRGGIVLVTLPIIVLPTTVGAGNLVAPALTAIALGTLPPVVVAAAAIAGLAVAGWLALGGSLAAALEAEGARIVAADADVRRRPVSDMPAGPAASDGRIAVRILAVRLIAMLPLAVALVWGSVRIVAETYRELTLPSEAGTSLVVRVVKDTPDVLLAIALAWMLGEMVAAVAARRIVLDGDGIIAGLRAGIVRTVRHPLTALTRFWLPTLALGLVVVASAVAASSAWSAVGVALGPPGDALPVLVAVVLFVALWIAGLFLAAVACAWRAAVWTIGSIAARGTFGGSTDRHPGDWRPEESSATL